jgi:hypothetical protein
MHYRQQIREKVATLVTGLTTTGSRVHQTRVYPLETLPALSVYTAEEEVQEDFEEMGEHTVVDITLRIEARSKKNADLDDELDTILSEVQTALAANITLDSLAYWNFYQGVENPEFTGEADQEHGLMVILYVVRTGFNRADPQTVVL